MNVISCSFSLEHNLYETMSCLQRCSKQEELKQIHARMLKTGLMQDSYVITKFLSFCISSTSSDFLPYAQIVFDGCDRPDTFLWNLMIRGFSCSDEPERSLLLYQRMLCSSAPHNAYTFPSLLKACSNLSAFEETTQIHAQITKLGYENDVYAVNSLINSYAVTGNFKLAHLLFDRIPEPDDVSWNSVIKDMNKEALQLFHEMQNSDVEPDNVSLANALSACAQLGALEQGKWIHSYLNKTRIRMDSVLGCVLIDMYAKCGEMEEALEVFKNIKKKSVQAWTALISGYAYHGHGREAISKFMEMQKMGIKPNVITFTAVLTACSYTGLVEEGKLIFYSMERDYNLKPTIEHYGCIVDLLGRAGLLDEAKRFIQEMPLKPNAVIWGALLKACRIHKNIELGEEIGEILIAIDPYHGGRYVHKANIHAMGKKWDKAAETRRLMKEQGVAKVPGCSTISLEGTTHEFLAGDRSHPEIEKIQSKWRIMRRKLEENGYVPELEDILLDLVDDDEREAIVHQHSEKLAITYGLIKSKPGTVIRIMKNLRVCKDCHKVTKLISKIYKRDIVMRDRTRFHHFRDGKCSCGDYW
ncbi:Pentatricopeptide repeat [Arabidopsis thaliana x Arabidopsis arenosa]|uniref:Pentatricopeptide repeat n=1 Tax=Arabidopsis thaliana x Arabidopsis arenosa TaxID=1240361 RepID=A0A8T2DEC7_9BRAS|nr:Pentatricopeptide repeat [Arabidopsis thaliana x Arabidopsis arenosa]